MPFTDPKSRLRSWCCTDRFHTPVSRRDRLEQSIPPTHSWGWARRLEVAIFGRRKQVLIDSEIFSFTESSSSNPVSLGLGAANFSDTNGVQAWLLGAEELKALAVHLRQMPGADLIRRSRIQTADGILALMFAGKSFSFTGQLVLPKGSSRGVGLSLGCFPMVHNNSIDLIADVTSSELATNAMADAIGSSLSNTVSIQTNFDTAIRVQIPKGSGIFWIEERSSAAGRKRTGILINLLHPKT